MTANIRLDISRHMGLSLALAGVGGFALGYAVCRFISKQAAGITPEDSAAQSREAEKKHSVVTESVPSTPRGSVSNASFHTWTQNGSSSDLKMALVVRSDMNMASGTIARHCAAATLGLFKKLHKARSPELRQWELGKSKKLTYTVDSEEAMLLLQAAAKREGLGTRVVVDEGMGNSKTVLAVGPAPMGVLQQLLHGHPELR